MSSARGFSGIRVDEVSQKANTGITNAMFSPPANKAAQQYVKPAIARTPSAYPADDVLNRMTLLKPMPLEIRRMQNWRRAQLKTSR